MSIVEELKFKFQQGNAIIRIIMVNVAVFVVFGIVNTILSLFNSNAIVVTITEWLILPASFSRFIFQPWSIISYTFFHEGFLHILFNMLWFYWIGQLLQQYLGNPKTYQAYFMGAIVGGLVYMISYHVFPYLIPSLEISTARGASAGVLSVVFATATLLPEYELSLFLIGSVRLKYIALVTLLLDLISIPYDNPGGHIAHIAGAFFGIIYIKLLQNGTDLSTIVTNIINFFVNLFQPKKATPFKKVHVNPKKPVVKTQSKIVTKDKTQQQIDEILDKISQSGYDSLTAVEKEFLFKAGK